MNRKAEVEQARLRRHAHIKRGMRIALYEINQLLAQRGEKLDVPDAWIDYTVALAEGGRKKAPFADFSDRIAWTMALRYTQRRAREFVAEVKRVFG